MGTSVVMIVPVIVQVVEGLKGRRGNSGELYIRWEDFKFGYYVITIDIRDTT